MYIISVSETEHTFALYNENKNRFRIDTGPKEQWDNSVWADRSPRGDPKLIYRFIDYIFSEGIEL